MFGLFRSPRFVDPDLGAFGRSRGRWRGSLVVAGLRLPLALAGSRAAPEAAALAAAKRLPDTWKRNRDAVARALVEHFAPYREAVEAGELEATGPLPDVTAANDVWPHVTLQSASVTPLGGRQIAEVALVAAWDEEHTLGARFEGAVFVELIASILPE